jgi:AmmeMemoRadiSam system protein B/AmmeMemoRadiSam system protein A
MVAYPQIEVISMKIKSILGGLVVSCLCLFSSLIADVRQPAVADMFYPADKNELAQIVSEHLQNADPPAIDGQIMALIVPHAGLVYSGSIAAYSYKLLENSGVNKVILCGPSHRHRFEGVSVYGPDIDWQMPMGAVSCDAGLCRQLLDQDKAIDIIPAAHEKEHCLEVQLPYLQTVLEDFTIVPAIMGRPDSKTIQTLANALASIELDNSTVMIASTDWQHYMPASEGWRYDSLGLECLKTLDPDRLEKYLIENKTQACGGAPAVSVMKAAIARGANKVKILKYGDSGDVTGDKSSVVSYVAAILYKSGKGEESSPKTGQKELPEKMILTDADKAKLLEIARQTIESHLTNSPLPVFDISDNLKQMGAAFVTLNKDDNLRGCIGQTVAIQPLHKTVSYCAIQAATADPRFRPVTSDELNNIHIEISVLTPLQRVESLDDIEVGRDGLMLIKGRYRGLLLPQVATDYEWNRTQFLEQTCRKAGLNKDAYKAKDAEVYKFQAIIFGE